MRKRRSADRPPADPVDQAAAKRRRGGIAVVAAGALFVTSLGVTGWMLSDGSDDGSANAGRRALSAPAALDPVPASAADDLERTADPRQPPLLNAAVHRTLTQERGKKVKEGRPAGRPIVEARRSDRRHTWVFGSSAIPPAGRSPDAMPEAALFLARKSPRGWDVALEGSGKFARYLRQAPASVVPAGEKGALARYSAKRAGAEGAGDLGLRLPWRVGDAWHMGGGPHGNSGSSRPFNSVDFNGGDGRVMAAAAGRVYRFCSSDRSRGLIRVIHDNGYATEYYHMLDTVQAADGAQVGQGEYLGHIGTELPCGGSATGPHVHFALRQGNTQVAVDGKTIGGWTFHEGASPYGGFAERNGQRVEPGRGALQNVAGPGQPDPTPGPTPPGPTPTGPTPTRPPTQPPGGGATGVVNSGWYKAVNLRSGPGLSYKIVGHAQTGDKVKITCSLRGDLVRSSWASSDLWLRLAGENRWASEAYVYVDKPKAVPTCPTTPSPDPSPTGTKPPSPTSSPTAAPTSTAPPPGGSKETTAEDEVTKLTNAERVKAGCAPLRTDERLRKASRDHSTDMRDRKFFSHNSPDGRTPWDRIKAAGYPAGAAENIAMGYRTPAEVVSGWMNSAGHRANILNCGLKAIGVGAAFGSGGPWWTQDFGRQ